MAPPTPGPSRLPPEALGLAGGSAAVGPRGYRHPISPSRGQDRRGRCALITVERFVRVLGASCYVYGEAYPAGSPSLGRPHPPLRDGSIGP
jgi:hypothetical protein